MSVLRIIILKNALQKPKPSSHCTVITFEEIKNWIARGVFLRHLFCYQEVKLLTYRLEVLSKPFITAILIRLLSRRVCCFEDEQGRYQSITIPFLVKLFWHLIRDLVQKFISIHCIHREIEQLSGECFTRASTSKVLDLSATPVYLRTDLWFGIRSGGSVGHIAGVLNHLDEFTGKPVFLTTDIIPTVRKDIETHIVLPDNSGWDFKELPGFFYNQTLETAARKLLGNKKISFIYQRYSVNNYAGVKLAQFYNVPFVLEYNGSEIWINRHWGKPLKHESLSELIEFLNLKAADVVVVVSQPMKDELVARGIDADKILVNPNGVDPERYSPGVDGSAVRRRYNLAGQTVIGFIGTFGRWHGAEVLAEAFGRLLREFPVYRRQVRLLMIGDGPAMPRVIDIVKKFNITDACILTGLIPQEEGPAHLAACDILASPHVPNPDGTPFFGSPTKLFEYMAMGKGIVASDLEQIGEVLKHNHTAWLVKPGDVESLMLGLKTLLDDKQLGDRLGRNARHEVMNRYTWSEHTRRIINWLNKRCG
ncbi:glycosyltransferase [Desulfallas sp. Bu1-1]|nr:glycosyltransferase [Desulfallas sp. Bu1-1]